MVVGRILKHQVSIAFYCSKIDCTSHIGGSQGVGEGGAGVMVFTDEGYFLFLPGSRVIFAVILFLTSNN